MSSNSEYFPPPSGPLSILTRSVALLRHEPDQLKNHAGLRFRPGYDDLDVLDWAEVVGSSGRRYALVRHRQSPQSGTEIVTSQDSLDPGSDIRDVLDRLNLNNKDVLWTAPDISLNGRTSKAAHRIPRRRVTVGVSPHGKMRVRLTSSDLSKLKQPVRGRGGFQSLLRKLQKQIEGVELQVSSQDVERLLRYSTAYGTGGFQGRTRRAIRSSSKRAAKKR